MLIIPIPPSLIFKQHTFLSIWFGLLSQRNFQIKSGSKINYEKTKGLFIGRLRGKRPRLTNISWISDNIKTLGVFHGYNIDTDDIWKKIFKSHLKKQKIFND
jgi:hypothetical protein